MFLNIWFLTSEANFSVNICSISSKVEPLIHYNHKHGTVITREAVLLSYSKERELVWGDKSPLSRRSPATVHRWFDEVWSSSQPNLSYGGIWVPSRRTTAVPLRATMRRLIPRRWWRFVGHKACTRRLTGKKKCQQYRFGDSISR